MTRATAGRRARRAGPKANPARGEHELELGGTAYRLRPSHTALETIEEETDLSTLQLIQLAGSGGLKRRDAGVVAAELIRAGAAADDHLTRNVSAERIAELIHEEGLAKVYAILVICLIDAAKGGRTSAGEAKAATATVTNGVAGAA